jgi:hypothetical protein
LLPTAAAVKLVRVGDDMAGLVPENSHAFRPRAALDVEDHFLFEPHQARMR